MRAGRVGAVVAGRRARQNSGRGNAVRGQRADDSGLTERKAEALYFEAPQEDRVATSKQYKARWNKMTWVERYEALLSVQNGGQGGAAPSSQPHPLHPPAESEAAAIGSDSVEIVMDEPAPHRGPAAPDSPAFASPIEPGTRAPVAIEVHPPRRAEEQDVETMEVTDAPLPATEAARPEPTSEGRKCAVLMSCACDIVSPAFCSVLALILFAAEVLKECKAPALSYVYVFYAAVAYLGLAVAYALLFKFAYFSGRAQQDPMLLWRRPGKDTMKVKKYSRAALGVHASVILLGVGAEVAHSCVVLRDYTLFSAMLLFVCVTVNFAVFRN
eukprot:TRINITY_DN29840_c0_g1_i1.p1 TRINITY_DN29840_c0_g1~~TRINITY_DN29840_c0_g1_i1.p1  ORF type:complete len:328 (+),score=104.59 TRINITY_DN29840_c0_g1_i1:57-1040(+)